MISFPDREEKLLWLMPGKILRDERKAMFTRFKRNIGLNMHMRKAMLLSFIVGMSVQSISIPSEETQPNRFEKAIVQFENMDKEHPPPEKSVLFIGSSSIRMWKTLVEDFAPLTVINRGFGGSQFTDAIHFANRIVIPYKPALILVYEGDNDIASKKSPERVLLDYKRFVAAVRKGLPNIPVYFISIKPSPSRWAIWEDMKEANNLIEKITEKDELLEFIDVSTPMLDKDGTVRPELFTDDNLHMNADGYRLWTRIIKPLMREYLKMK